MPETKHPRRREALECAMILGWLAATALLRVAEPFAASEPGVALDESGTTTTPAVVDLSTLDAAGPPVESPRPRVVVVVTFDHFRGDYLTRFGDQFTTDGFRRLMKEGYWARESRYRHGVATSAPGLAALVAGACPNRTGIIGDAWFDPSAGRLVGSVEDGGERLLGSRAIRADRSGASPRRLAAPVVGDVLRASSNNRARVVALSMTEHAAVLLGGASANRVLWWDGQSSQFVTSTYYAQRLDPWVVLFNDQLRLRSYEGVQWTLLRPEAWYSISSKDDTASESDLLGRTFPHVIVPANRATQGSVYQRLTATPLGDDLLLELAGKAIGAERLGADDVPDLLFLSFGSSAFVGRNFGPYSRETQDLVLRTDLLIGRLLRLLDGQFGPNYALVVASSGGIAPIPETQAERGLSAGRVAPGPLMESAERFLRSRFRSEVDPESHPFLSAFASSWIWLNEASIRARGLDAKEVRTALRDFLRQQDGIAAAYTADELVESARGAGVADSYAAAFALDQYRGRSGDVAVLPRPYWIISPAREGTASGTPYAYDQRGILLVYGKGIVRGREATEPVSPEDVAPTLAALLGIDVPPCSEGRILPGVFSE